MADSAGHSLVLVPLTANEHTAFERRGGASKQHRLRSPAPVRDRSSVADRKKLRSRFHGLGKPRIHPRYQFERSFVPEQWLVIPNRLMVRDEIAKVSQFRECTRNVSAVSLGPRTVRESLHGGRPKLWARCASVLVGTIAETNPKAESGTPPRRCELRAGKPKPKQCSIGIYYSVC